MKEILTAYGGLLHSVDEWFGWVVQHYHPLVVCTTGCNECCRSLFDITLLDAFYLRSGFDRLDDDVKKAVSAQAEDRLLTLQDFWPEYGSPFTLNHRTDEDWQELMRDDDETPCVLLGTDGRCLLYDYRPMTCRLHGIPLIDASGEVMDDEWCTLNFSGQNPLEFAELRWEFRRLFQGELEIFREFSNRLFGFSLNELDTLIPAALLIDFSGFDWKAWLPKQLNQQNDD